jgi:spore germination protein YaaH
MAWSRPTKIIFLFVAILSLCSFFPVTTEADTVAKPSYTRLFYFRDNALARQSFFTNYKYIDIFAPQSYALDSTGNLSGSLDQNLVAFAHISGVKIMPLVTNGAFSEASYQGILDNPGAQDVAIASLINEAKLNGYYGWEIDFEQMDMTYRDKFSVFIKKAGAEMKQNNLSLSVSVIAKFSDDPKAYPSNLWTNLIGVYDYSALASSTDFVSLMSYDDPYSKGPVVEYPWLNLVLDYSLKYIPAEKLSLGIPLYYWKWNDATGKLVGVGGNEGIDNVLKKYKVTSHFSVAQQEPYLTYKSGKVNYTIWYENARSVKKKINLVTDNHLQGFSAWVLGLELPSIYNVIGK